MMRPDEVIPRIKACVVSARHRILYRWHLIKVRSHWQINIMLKSLDILSFMAAVACVAGIIAYIGYDHDVTEQLRIKRIFHTLQWIFSLRVISTILLNFEETVRNTRLLKWVINLWIILSLWPLIFQPSAHPMSIVLQDIIYSNAFMLGALASFSILEISYGVMRMLGRRTNPPLILATSFLIFIAVGAFLLSMPNCTRTSISFIDALFVSTSAVCITGLTPVDIATTFTPFGQAVLAVLIQTGGLGVLTFTSFFALFFSGGQSVYSQLLIKDMIYSKSMNSLLPTLLYILVFTLAVEAIGALAIWLSIHDVLTDMDAAGQLKFSAFLSLSAFCNAGFSTLPDGMANARLMNSDQSIYIVVSIIVLAGSIGFPVLVNVRDAGHEYIKRIWSRLRGHQLVGRQVRLYNVNTKISVYTTLLILTASTLIFWILEHDNTLAGFSTFDQMAQSLFNATIPRSSGFQSVSPTRFMPATMVIIMLLMWIGGASQSTAGGVKVNTIAALWLNLKSIVLGREHVTAFNRTISMGSIRRANAVVTLSIGFLAFYSVTLLILEPSLPTKSLIFEATSALFTVGSSLGITPSLSTASKALLCTAMFLGRVGIISLLIGATGNRTDMPARFPTDNIIIN